MNERFTLFTEPAYVTGIDATRYHLERDEMSSSVLKPFELYGLSAFFKKLAPKFIETSCEPKELGKYVDFVNLDDTTIVVDKQYSLDLMSDILFSLCSRGKISDFMDDKKLETEIKLDLKHKKIAIDLTIVNEEVARAKKCCVFNTEIPNCAKLKFIHLHSFDLVYAFSFSAICTNFTLFMNNHVLPIHTQHLQVINAFMLMGAEPEMNLLLKQLVSKMDSLLQKPQVGVKRARKQNAPRKGLKQVPAKSNTYTVKQLDKYFKDKQTAFGHKGPLDIYKNSYGGDKGKFVADYDSFSTQYPKSSSIVSRMALDKVVDDLKNKGLGDLTRNQIIYLIACDDFSSILNSIKNGVSSAWHNQTLRNVISNLADKGLNLLSEYYPPVAPVVSIARKVLPSLRPNDSDSTTLLPVQQAEAYVDSNSMLNHASGVPNLNYNTVFGQGRLLSIKGLTKVNDVSIDYISGVLAPTLGIADAYPAIPSPCQNIITSYQVLDLTVPSGSYLYLQCNPLNFNAFTTGNTSSAANFISYILATNSTVGFTNCNPVIFGNTQLTSNFDLVMINSVVLEIVFYYPPLTSNSTITYTVLDAGTDVNDNNTNNNVIVNSPSTISKMPFAKTTDTNSIINSKEGKLTLNWFNTTYDEDTYGLHESSTIFNSSVGTAGPRFAISTVTGTIQLNIKATLCYTGTVNPSAYNIMGIGRLPARGPMTDKFFDIFRTTYPQSIYWSAATLERIVTAARNCGSSDADSVLSSMAAAITELGC